MSDKIARLGIERDNDLMYYIKNGDVWATPRKQKGQPKGKAQKIAAAGLELDYSRFIYYLDGDGDVARKARALGGGGGRRTKTKADAPTKAKAGKAVAAAAAPSTSKRSGTKSPEQLDREIEECLARAKGGGNGGAKAGSTRSPRASVGSRVKYVGPTDQRAGLVKDMTGTVTRVSDIGVTFTDDDDGEATRANWKDVRSLNGSPRAVKRGGKKKKARR